MISILKGDIQEMTKDGIVLMTAGGVGYDVKVDIGKLENWKIAEEKLLYTYLKVSENAMELYGFITAEERSFFQLLLSVSGVGPKSAMNILKLGSLSEIQSAIARSDAKYLTAVQGMGKKTAERLVVELKSKVGGSGSKSAEQGDGGVLGEVIDALVSMGYGRDEAKAAVKLVESKGKNTEVVLRLALQQMK